jgi:hypothetical protein
VFVNVGAFLSGTSFLLSASGGVPVCLSSKSFGTEDSKSSSRGDANELDVLTKLRFEVELAASPGDQTDVY